MTQTQRRPTSGARYVLDRLIVEPDAPTIYRGFVHLPDADIPLEVGVASPDGSVSARVLLDAPIPSNGPSCSELERVAAALVKSAIKSALQSGRSLPRRIARWRG